MQKFRIIRRGGNLQILAATTLVEKHLSLPYRPNTNPGHPCGRQLFSYRTEGIYYTSAISHLMTYINLPFNSVLHQ